MPHPHPYFPRDNSLGKGFGSPFYDPLRANLVKQGGPLYDPVRDNILKSPKVPVVATPAAKAPTPGVLGDQGSTALTGNSDPWATTTRAQ